MSALNRVARNVRDLTAATDFHCQILGFTKTGPIREDPALAACLGVRRVQSQFLRRGQQSLELTQCAPAGPADPAAANDLAFQHIALVTNNILAAAQIAIQAGAASISTGGPVKLPPAAGAVTAFKFRDPEGHPLEYLQFPDSEKNALSGYDHSAIAVANIARSIAFYARLGFHETAAGLNQGPEQDALDGLPGTLVDVVALSAGGPPHIELLHYRRPPGQAPKLPLNALAADRLVLPAPAGQLCLLRDPDGHVVLLDGRRK